MKKTINLLLALFIINGVISCKQKSSSEDASAESATDAKAVSDKAAESVTENSNENTKTIQIEAGQITAGEWNDLNNWDFWKSLSKNNEFSEMGSYWNYNLDNRVSVNVQFDSKNMVNVPVALLNSENEIIWKSKTDNNGKAELWSKANNQSNNGKLKVKIGNQVFETIEVNKNINNITLKENLSTTKKKIDIAFMVDATGSMGDEIDYLKMELTDVISKIKSKNQNANVNTATVFYRDFQDEYVTKKSDFSNNNNETVGFIKQQSADGGGDFPEAVEIALKESLDLNWSDDATARILFLVLDAPPHHEDQVLSELHNLVALASSKGIKIIPITASGIDKETEFLMRYMAIATNGSYVFITNDSGIGNDHLVASVGEYKVELLNELIIRLVNENLK